MNEKNHPLNGFFQQGVPRTDNVSGGQYITDCPLCERDGKFYINVESKLWDCKVCQEKGNYIQFLEKISKKNQDFLEKNHIEALAVDRNLPVQAFNGYEIGWDGEKFTFPVKSLTGKFVGMKCYKPGFALIPAKDTLTMLFGADRLKKNSRDPVYICEGEWDLIAMTWLLKRINKPGVVVAVPGANTFKEEWVEWFYQRDVIALYDNDKAGKQGEMRCYKLLTDVAKSLQFIHWPTSKGDGYDTRDLIGKVAYEQKKPKKCFRLIEGWLQDVPRELISEAVKDKYGKYTLDEKRAEKLEPIEFPEVIEAFQKFLFMPDITPIKVMLASVIANKIPGDMVWMFLVAPPSSAKTELITSLFQCRDIVSITSMTQNTLISGMQGPDRSLLPKLKDKILTIKDFTTVLTMGQQQRDAVFGQLRDAYDRRSEKMFGHGEHKIFHDIHFGILAGVTNSIENIAVMQQTLGERFLKYYLPFDHSEEETMKKMHKAVDNTGFEPEKQKELQFAVKRFFANFQMIVRPGMNPSIKERIIYLSRMVAKMRGVVARDFRREQILYKPQTEGPMRIGKQLVKMAISLAALEGKKEVTEEEFRIVRQIALGSCPSRVEAVVKHLYQLNGRPNTHAEIVSKIGFNHHTIKAVTEDLQMLGMLKIRGALRRTFFTLSDEAVRLIEKGEVYQLKEPGVVQPKRRVFVV